jgi:predicted MPP superfamily phosphohydrolase
VVPGAVWLAGTFLAIPWVAVTAALGPFVSVPELGWIWYAIALTGVPTSLLPRREVVRLVVDGADAGERVQRLPVVRRLVSTLPDAPVAGALRVVQITDPHLGPFRSEASLHELCGRAVAAKPDLLLVTGDLFTIEGAGSPEALVRALAPLRALRGRVFACLGNHDHEHPEEVSAGLRAAGVRLLVDEAALVETPVGTVQIVGLDHRWRHRERHGEVLRSHPRPPGALRVVLLHDPGAFRALPPGEADLVLSGHTHGGHVGLVSLGLDWTAIGALTGMPDHGWWGRGRDRLYVHRASGHYGFPLRVGVPMEESVLEVVRPVGAAAGAPRTHRRPA